MRWDALFADLEGQAAAELQAERRGELADRFTAERGRLRLIDRMRPLVDHPGREVQLAVAGHDLLRGQVSALGADWVLLKQAGGDEVLVPLRAVCWIRGLGSRSAEPGWEGVVGARLRLPSALRRLQRQRTALVVDLLGGQSVVGRLVGVGIDHVELDELAAGPADSARRLTVPVIALAALRRHPAASRPCR